MRVAFIGKGGAGKSVIAGTFARLLARTGTPVLAIDSDPMPGLAFSVGVDVSDAPIPDDAVEENPDEQGPRYRLRAGLTAAEAVRRYSAHGPDGVQFLQFGKLHGPAAGLIRSQFAFRQIVDELVDGDWHLVGDLPGGTRQPFFGWANYARHLLVVAEPTAQSLLSARRLARLAASKRAPTVTAVANKVREPADADLVAARTGLPVVGAVPWDELLVSAERRGRPLLDDAPESVAVRAIESMLQRLRDEEAGA